MQFKKKTILIEKLGEVSNNMTHCKASYWAELDLSLALASMFHSPASEGKNLILLLEIIDFKSLMNYRENVSASA